MKAKTLIALSIAAAFPLAAIAGGSEKSADSGTVKSSPTADAGTVKSSPSAASGSSAKSDASGKSGAEAMFKALDKNKDGFISKEEAKGTPHDKDFATLDKNNDGKLSRQEHAAAPEHQNEKAASGTSSSGTSSSGTSSSGTASSGTGTPKQKY